MSLGEIALSVVGLALAAAQVAVAKLSLKGIDYAARAAKAAEEAVTVTRQMAQEQSRAYIDISHARLEVCDVGQRTVIEFKIKNTRATPARGIVASYGGGFIVPDDVARYIANMPPELGEGAALGGHEERTGRITTDQPLSAATWEQYRAQGMRVYCYGLIKYRDIYDRPWTTHFKFEMTANEHEVFKICPDGNEST